MIPKTFSVLPGQHSEGQQTSFQTTSFLSLTLDDGPSSVNGPLLGPKGHDQTKGHTGQFRETGDPRNLQGPRPTRRAPGEFSDRKTLFLPKTYDLVRRLL